MLSGLSQAVVLSSIAFVVGLVSWAVPAWKYHKITKVGVFALPLLLCGVILMTTFKWDEIAVEVSGAKVELKKAQQQITTLTEQLGSAEAQLAKWASLTDTALQRQFATQASAEIVQALKAKGSDVDPQLISPILFNEIESAVTKVSLEGRELQNSAPLTGDSQQRQDETPDVFVPVPGKMDNSSTDKFVPLDNRQ